MDPFFIVFDAFYRYEGIRVLIQETALNFFTHIPGMNSGMGSKIHYPDQSRFEFKNQFVTL